MVTEKCDKTLVVLIGRHHSKDLIQTRAIYPNKEANEEKQEGWQKELVPIFMITKCSFMGNISVLCLSRTWKPFNPILGETYEMVNHNGITFIAEQVSHHPPMSAAHAENEHFTYDVTSKLKTKFLGNSVEVYPVGMTRVTLKKSGVVFDLVPPPTKVNNLIFGRTWVDSPGEMVMTNLITGDKVVLYFQPCGWFGAGRYEVDGYVYDAVEEPKILMTGKWNESMSCQPCDQEGEPLPGTELKEVHFAATKDTLSRYFNKFGEVLKVIIVNDAATGQPRGSAYVEFLRKESAESALSLNGTYFLFRSLKIVNVSEQKPINILAIVAGLSIAQMEMKREGINNEVLDDAVPLAWEAPLVACAATNSVGRRDVLRRPIANSAGRTGVTLRRSIARMQAQFGDIAELNT